MRRLVLHIGPHKTGTSSFQHWLVSHAQALDACGIAQPLALLNARGNGSSLAGALLAAPGDRSAEQDDLLAAFSDFCASTPDKDVLLSAEGLARILHVDKAPEGPEDTTADNALRTRAAQRLMAHLAPLGFDRIDVILLVREPVGHMTSAYLQRLKMFRKRMRFDLFPISGVEVKDYASGLRALSRAGFTVAARPYRAPQDSRPLPQRLTALAGFQGRIAGRVPYETPARNLSPGWLKTIGLGHLYGLIERGNASAPPSRLAALRAGLLEAVEGQEIPGDTPLVLFAPEAARDLLDRQETRLAGIEEFSNGMTAADFAASFPAPAPQSPLSHRQLDDDATARLANWLNRVAARAGRIDRLTRLITPAEIRNIATARTGVHASPLSQITCLGGSWGSPTLHPGNTATATFHTDGPNPNEVSQ